MADDQTSIRLARPRPGITLISPTRTLGCPGCGRNDRIHLLEPLTSGPKVGFGPTADTFECGACGMSGGASDRWMLELPPGAQITLSGYTIATDQDRAVARFSPPESAWSRFLRAVRSTLVRGKNV